MKLSEQQKFILFALGKCSEKSNQSLKAKMLEASISKSAFIEIVGKSGITKKKERALYKNLESLEKSKLIAYKNKNLELTERGKDVFDKIHNKLYPYFNLTQVVDSTDPLRLTSKAKAVFRIE